MESATDEPRHLDGPEGAGPEPADAAGADTEGADVGGTVAAVRAGAEKARAKTVAAQQRAAELLEEAKHATTDALRDGFDKVIESIDDLATGKK